MVSASYLGLYVLMMLPGAASSTTVPVNMWAVHALQEQRADKVYDPELVQIKKALEDLPYNTFRTVKTARENMTLNEATRISIDSTYTLVAIPIDCDKDRRVRLDITVEIASSDPKKTPLKALQTRLSMQPNNLVKLRGLVREPGEMVVVLATE